jgi:hypothetical protein
MKRNMMKQQSSESLENGGVQSKSEDLAEDEVEEDDEVKVQKKKPIAKKRKTTSEGEIAAGEKKKTPIRQKKKVTTKSELTEKVKFLEKILANTETQNQLLKSRCQELETENNTLKHTLEFEEHTVANLKAISDRWKHIVDHGNVVPRLSNESAQVQAYAKHFDMA